MEKICCSATSQISSDSITTSRVYSSAVWRKEGIRGGKPLLKETRVPVETILNHLALGWTIEQLSEAFPSVKKEHVVTLLKDLAKLF